MSIMGRLGISPTIPSLLSIPSLPLTTEKRSQVGYYELLWVSMKLIRTHNTNLPKHHYRISCQKGSDATLGEKGDDG